MLETVYAAAAQKYVNDEFVGEKVSLSVFTKTEGGKKFIKIHLISGLYEFRVRCEAMLECISLDECQLEDGLHHVNLARVILAPAGVTIYAQGYLKPILRLTTRPIRNCEATSLFMYQIPVNSILEQKDVRIPFKA